MLKIFLSSTTRDLKTHRAKILDKLDAVFEGVGMEHFIPDGSDSQQVSISYLNESDIVIFLIAPHYGSLLDNCTLKEKCKAECPMKTGRGRISYTHCEYKNALAEGMLHQTYLIEDGWQEQTLAEAISFRKELEKESCYKIKDIEDLGLICNNLAKQMIDWHSQGILDFTNFCDRSRELIIVIDNLEKNNRIEVYGVGGIGKTALVQVALLIQKLKGKNVVTVGTGKSYASGSGYDDFREKCEDIQHKTSGDKIDLHDIIEALSNYIPDIEGIKKDKKENIIQTISNLIDQKKIILFIDDFHLADEDVRDLIKCINSVIFSSRKNTGLAINEVNIIGIREKDREDLINLLCKLLDKELSDIAKKKVQQLTEGHPVSTKLLVRNYQKINFDKIQEFNLKHANSAQVEEFYNRVIENILSENAYKLLRHLSVLNPNNESNIDRKCVTETYKTEYVVDIFDELLDTGMLKQRKNKEKTYEFSYKHIQDALEFTTEITNHHMAINYYRNKRNLMGDSINDEVEMLYHQIRSDPNENLVDIYVDLASRVTPVNYSFRKLIEVGEKFRSSLKGEKRATIFHMLGRLYEDLKMFEKAEKSFFKARDIYNELIKNDSKAYVDALANVQKNIGDLYFNFTILFIVNGPSASCIHGECIGRTFRIVVR